MQLPSNDDWAIQLLHALLSLFASHAQCSMKRIVEQPSSLFYPGAFFNSCMSVTDCKHIMGSGRVFSDALFGSRICKGK